jgi:methionyl-tRNA formyltransferase
MFDTVLLLAGALELPYLAAILAQFNPDLDIVGIDSQDVLAALLPALLARARLVGFATPLLVPARILEGMGYGAYNFHPGPPEYRGWHPHCFAVYEGAKRFGVTAHVMSERVDSGAVVGVERFAVPEGSDAEGLGEIAYGALLGLFSRLAPALATDPRPLPTLAEAWSGRATTRRDFAAMCELSKDMPEEEVQRRLRAFGSGDGFSQPVPAQAAGMTGAPTM